MMNLIKSGLGLVAGMGAGAIVTNIVSAFIPKDANRISKLGYLIGGICIVGVVSKQASEYAEESIEELIELKETLEGEQIHFESKDLAEKTLSTMKNALEENGMVTLQEFAACADISVSNPDINNYGWTNLDRAKVVSVGNRHVLYLPKVETFKGDDK